MKNLFLTLTTFLLLSSCNPFKSDIEKALNTIDKTVSKMNSANADWQSIVKNLSKDLPNEVRSIIGNDLNIIVHDMIGAAGTEVMCNMDFIKKRTINSLLNLKAKLIYKAPRILPPGGFCTLNISAINLNASPESWRLLSIYGYDLNALDRNNKMVQLALIGKDTLKFIDEALIGRTTNYQLTLNLGALLPDLIENKYDKIQLFWNGDPKGMPQVLIQKWTAQTKVIYFLPSPIVFVPPFSGGGPDRDFNTKANNVTNGRTNVEFRVSKSTIEARVFMDAMESGGDNTRVGVSIDPATKQETEATAWGPWTRIYTLDDPQWEIKEFTSNIQTPLNFTVASQGPKLYPMGGGSVSHYTVDIDQNGDEAGFYTKVTVDWNKLSLLLIQKKPGNR